MGGAVGEGVGGRQGQIGELPGVVYSGQAYLVYAV